MLARIALLATLLAGLPVVAAPKLNIHVTIAARVTEDKALLRTLETALAHSLAARSRALPAVHSIDVSLVRLEVSRRGADLLVLAEVRAIVADERGRIQATAGARAMAQGNARDRALLMRDAVSDAASQLAKRLAER